MPPAHAALLATVLEDFAAEAAALEALLVTLDESIWTSKTPAVGWDVRDSVAHLATGDELALECVVHDRAPAMMREGLDAVVAGHGTALAFESKLLQRGRSMPSAGVHRWWREGNAALCDALSRVDPEHRLPWGPNRMSPVSFTTARLMETWAHGLDCFDAAGVSPADTDRLRHVARLALSALPYAFMVKGTESPGPVRLDLTSPSGERWQLGPHDAPTVITGRASDWCRVAVHRDRRGERERLHASGPDAADVLHYVQAYL